MNHSSPAYQPSGGNEPSHMGHINCAPHLASVPRRTQLGLSLVEVIIALTLFSLLMAGGLTAIVTMQSTARRQGVYNSALALVESKQEWFRSQTYAPPADPFLSTTNTITETIAITLSESGSTNRVNVTLTSTVSVVSSGHLVSVVATYTYQNKPVTITIQSVVNSYSVANARLS